MGDSTGSTSMTYDDADRMTQLATPQGTMTYHYDNANRQDQMTDASGTTYYVYDDANRLYQLTNPFSQMSQWTYDAADRVTRQDNGNGSYALYTYDSRSRPTVIDHMKSDTVTRIAKEQTTYDDANNVTQRILAGVTTNYTYDDINQLTEEAIVGGTTTDYTYDANGNRATKVVGGTTETYHNDDADKLTSITVGATTTKSYHFDANGNTDRVTTSAGTTYLNYDYENRVTGITYPSTATNSFAYNGLDTRVSKTDSAGSATYRRNGIGVTAPVLNDGTVAYTPGLSTHTSTQDRFDHTDRLGSNIRQTNPSNGVTSNVTWDAFGNATSTSGTQVGPFGFAGAWGYQQDSDSGLKLLGHRYYDSSTGRFLSRDPLHDGRNWYMYGENDPVGTTDPYGLSVGAAIGGAIGGLFIGGLVVITAPVSLTAIGVTAVTIAIFTGAGAAIGGAIGGDGPNKVRHDFRDGFISGLISGFFAPPLLK